MELRQLRYFVAVVEAGSVGRAAQKLHVSQPPVTRQIQKLESEVGGPLFLRTAKGVELTEAGRAFLPEARSILAQTQLAVARGRSAHLGEIGSLEVGFMGSPIYSAVPQILRYFRAHSPKVSIALHRLRKQQQIDWLRDGRLHVGFARFFPTEPDLESMQVDLERPMVAVSADADLRGEAIRLADVAGMPLIVFPAADRPNFADTTMEIFARARVKPRLEHTAEDLTSALALTAAGLGYCLAPETVAAMRWPGVRFLPIVGAKPVIPVNCIFRRDRRSPVLSAFLSALKRYDRRRQGHTDRV